MTEPKGISIHLGLNAVDAQHYGGWPGTLTACEFDADDMKALAEGLGYQATVLKTRQATSANFLSAMAKAARELTHGDILMITYSGHGGQVPDLNGDESENAGGDNRDETWVLYDRELVDDELYALWGKFEKGVRIIMVSDSCHSGTMSRAINFTREAEASGIPDGVTPPTSTKTRWMPTDVQDRTYQQHKQLYDDLQRANPQGERVAIGAAVILLSGCQDNQFSLDGTRNGLFTQNLKQVYADGSFKGGYKRFLSTIRKKMPWSQSPNFFPVGVHSRTFERQQPFSIRASVREAVPVGTPEG